MDQVSPAVARALLACSATFELGQQCVQGHTAQCVTDEPYGDPVQPELHRESKPAWAIDDAANKKRGRRNETMSVSTSAWCAWTGSSFLSKKSRSQSLSDFQMLEMSRNGGKAREKGIE